MKPGIYHVIFTSVPLQTQGDGLIVVKDGTINGGDAGYIYRGNFQADGRTLSATLNVKRWSRSAVSVFGNIAELDLKISAQMSEDFSTFTGEGAIAQNTTMRMTFRGERIEDAA